MENSTTFYRIYLKERIRKHLGINLKNKKIYLFKLKDRMYLSTDCVPKKEKTHELKVKLGLYSWFIDIPTELLDYTPSSIKLLNTIGKVLELVKSEK